MHICWLVAIAVLTGKAGADVVEVDANGNTIPVAAKAPAVEQGSAAATAPSLEPAGGGSGGSDSGGAADKGSGEGSGDLSAISRELAETEVLIQAQQKKLALLEQLRRDFLAGKRGGVTVRQALAGSSAGTDAGGDNDDDGWGSTLAEYLVPRARVNASAGLGAIALASFNCRRQPAEQKGRRRAPAMVELLVLATADGKLVFHEADTGYKLLTVPAGHPGGADDDGTADGNAQPPRTTALVMAQHGESPVLLAGGSDGSLVAHRLTLWRDRVVVAGRAPLPVPDPSGDVGEDGRPVMLETPKPEPHAVSGFALEAAVVGVGRGGSGGGDPDEKDAAAKDAAARGSPVTAVAMYTRRKQRFAIAALASGAVHVHRLNGTLVGRHLAPAPGVADIAVVGARLALAVGTGVRFVNLQSLQDMDTLQCHGSLSRITALAVANARSTARGTLYAATAAGELLAFDTMAPAPGGTKRDAAHACRALRKVGPAVDGGAGAGGSSVRAALVRGYVLLAGGAQLAVRNVSDSLRAVRGGALPIRGDSGNDSGSGSAVVASVAMPRRNAAVFVAVATLGSAAPTQVTVFQSLLPDAVAKGRNGGSFDLNQIRNVAMGVVLVGVVGWQLLKRQRGTNVAAQFNDPAFLKGFQEFQQKRGARGGGGGRSHFNPTGDDFNE